MVAFFACFCYSVINRQKVPQPLIVRLTSVHPNFYTPVEMIKEN